ncbi:hypothetical protein BGW38_009539, partial [Lunasporangiospora selenospora]
AATFRKGKRQIPTRKKHVKINRAHCIEAVTQALRERLREKVLAARSQDSQTCIAATVKESLLGQDTPRNVRPRALALLRNLEPGLSPDVSVFDLPQGLGPGRSFRSIWQETVRSHFDTEWEAASSGTKKPVVKSSTVSKRKRGEDRKGKSVVRDTALIAGSSKRNDPDDEPDDEPDDAADNVLGDSEKIRTCPTTFKKILRPELQPHLKALIQIAERRQDDMTRIMDEVS